MIDKIKIRPDLQDIDTVIYHLYEMSDYFLDTEQRITTLWKMEPGAPYRPLDNGLKKRKSKKSISIVDQHVSANWEDFEKYIKNPSRHPLSDKVYATEDSEFIYAFNSLYKDARSVSNDLSIGLPLLNDIQITPNLNDYIGKLNLWISWVIPGTEIIKRCHHQIKLKKHQIDDWSLNHMTQLHEDQLNKIKDLTAIRESIKECKLFKIQNRKKQRAADPLETENFKVLSPDYRLIIFRGEEHKLTPSQARIVERLCSAYSLGQNCLSKAVLLEDPVVGGQAIAGRLPDIFKNSPLKNKLVVQDGKGFYRLNI
jgi:hypothetical protein